MTNNSRRLITYQVAVRSQEPLGCCLLECGNKSCGDITSDKVRNYCSKARKRNFVLCRGRIKSKEDKEDDTLSLNRSLFPSFILIFLLSLAVLGGPRESGAGELQATWMDNSNNEEGSKIERRTGTTQTYTQIAIVGANITSYNDSG